MDVEKDKNGVGRIRWRLLVLLWVWALLMFVTFDLFVDVPAFDRVRPESETYRRLRSYGHELVADAKRPPPLISIPEARAAPPPPQGYRGTPLQWRLRNRLVSPRRVAGLLDDFGELRGRDRLALLRAVARAPSKEYAPQLLRLRPKIPRDPLLLSSFGFACMANFEVQLKLAQEEAAIDRLRAFDGSVGELATAAIDAEATKLAELRIHVDEQGWGAARRLLTRLRRLVPGLEKSSRFADMLARLRPVVANALRTALIPKPGYRGGVEAIRLADTIQDSGLRDLLLDLVENRHTVAVKLLPADVMTHAVFLDYSVKSTIAHGSARQRDRLAALLADALSSEADPLLRRRLWSQARRLGRNSSTPGSALRTLVAARAQGSFELAARVRATARLRSD